MSRYIIMVNVTLLLLQYTIVRFPKKITTHKNMHQQSLPFLSLVTPRTFVIDSCDQLIGSVLKENGWKQIARNSVSWQFKWVWKMQAGDLEGLKDGQLVNHFRGSEEISTKLGLSLLYRKNPVIMDSGKSYLSYYPRSYNLSTQRQQFIQNYLQTGILNLLKKIVVCLQLYHPKQYEQALLLRDSQEGKGDSTGDLLLRLFNEGNIGGKGNGDGDGEFRVNGRLLIRLLFFLENIFSIDQIYEFKKQQLLQLVSYSKRTLPLQPTSNPSQITPSIDALSLLLSYHKKCLKQIIGFYQDGFSNIWVIKSNHSSRGRNIVLLDTVEEMEACDNGMKLVQKYVENIWVLHQMGDRQRKGFPGLERILGKKFDIRLWVLVRSFTPLVIYVYDEAYLRISAQSYKLDALDSREAHLTNFSINWKDKNLNTQKQNTSYLLLSQLMRYLKEQQGVDTDALRGKINTAIVQTLRLVDIKEDPRCFELFGFDIILDAELNPWILECNMSPACSPRGQLRNLVRNMTTGMLTILGLIDGNINGWKLVYDEKAKNQKVVSTCRVFGETSQNFGGKVSFMRTSMMNWNDLLLSTRRLDWNKYKFVEGCHVYMEKVQYLQKFFKKRYSFLLFKSFSNKNISRSLHLIQILSKIAKKVKKHNFHQLKLRPKPKPTKKKR